MASDLAAFVTAAAVGEPLPPPSTPLEAAIAAWMPPDQGFVLQQLESSLREFAVWATRAYGPGLGSATGMTPAQLLEATVAAVGAVGREWLSVPTRSVAPAAAAAMPMTRDLPARAEQLRVATAQLAAKLTGVASLMVAPMVAQKLLQSAKASALGLAEMAAAAGTDAVFGVLPPPQWDTEIVRHVGEVLQHCVREANHVVGLRALAAAGHTKPLRTVVINLDARPDRMRCVDAQLRLFGAHALLPLRQSAVVGRQLDLDKLPLTARARAVLRTGVKTSAVDIDSVGAVGCSLSHRQAWLEFVADDAAQETDGMLVLEDDVLLDPVPLSGFLERVCAVDASSPAAMRPDLVLLGAHGTQMEDAKRASLAADPSGTPLGPLRWWTWPRGPLCTGSHAYYISKRAARALSRMELFFPLDSAIDSYMQLAWTALDAEARSGWTAWLWSAARMLPSPSDIVHPTIDVRSDHAAQASGERIKLGGGASPPKATQAATTGAAGPTATGEPFPLHMSLTGLLVTLSTS